MRYLKGTAIGMLLLTTCAGGVKAQDPTTCEAGPGVIVGHVVGDGPASWPFVEIGTCYQARVDRSGSFVISGIPRGNWILFGRSFHTCLEPKEVDLTAGDTANVQMRRVSLELPHAMIIIHGNPWVPSSYHQLQCAAGIEYLRQNPDVRTLETLPRLPSPDSVVTMALTAPQFKSILHAHDPVRLKIWYGSPAVRQGMVGGKKFKVVAGRSEPADAYILVHAASPEHVDLQVGITSLMERAVRVRLNLRDGTSKVVRSWP